MGYCRLQTGMRAWGSSHQPQQENIMSKIVSKQSAGDLNDLLDEREIIIEDIGKLKGRQSSVEHKVKRRLIQTQQTDLLSVNWSRLNRSHRR